MGNLFVLAHVLSYRYEWALRTKSSSSSLLFHLNTCTLLIFFVDVVLSHNLGQFVTIFILLSTNHPSKILYCVCSTNDVLSCVCPCHASKSEGEEGRGVVVFKTVRRKEQKFHTVYSGGSRERGMRATLSPIFFHFHAVFGNNYAK